MDSPYKAAPRAVRVWWTAAVVAAVGYGLFLAAAALTVPAGADLTGRFWAQPAVKASMAVLLAFAAGRHPVARERRWLVPALLLSALGDFFLAIPWWPPAFVCGLGSFLLAHLCFLGALLPLRASLPLGAGADPGRGRLVLVAAVWAAFIGMLTQFWPAMLDEGLAVPVIAYMSVLGAMVSAALLARLPTPWTAVGGLLFAVSDGMIGIGKFLLGSQALELPIWWCYAASMVLITAGFFFGRTRAEISVGGGG
ncbi:MAG: lysoplasmalogenase [Mycobacterium sp.]|nr:lysoplasmalogenase [Mycobacterium sp.]